MIGGNVTREGNPGWVASAEDRPTCRRSSCPLPLPLLLAAANTQSARLHCCGAAAWALWLWQEAALQPMVALAGRH